MGNKTRILERKLDELECQLGVRCTTTDAGDLEQRFSFLEKILAAEITSRPDNCDQFHEIGHRIAVLKAAFGDRSDHRHDSPSSEDSTTVCTACIHNLQTEDATEPCSPNSSSVEDNAEAAAAAVESKRPRCHGFHKYCAVFSFGVMIGAILGVQLLSPINAHFSAFPDASLFLLPPT